MKMVYGYNMLLREMPKITGGYWLPLVGSFKHVFDVPFHLGIIIPPHDFSGVEATHPTLKNCQERSRDDEGPRMYKTQKLEETTETITYTIKNVFFLSVSRKCCLKFPSKPILLVRR